MHAIGFPRVAATVFALAALVHAYRAFERIPVQFGSTSVPEWISWAAVVGAGALSVWGFRTRA